MKKELLTLAITVLAALAPPVAVNQFKGESEPATIVAVETADVGELVHLTYDASRVAWQIPGEDFQINGSEAWVSFRKPGTYQIVVAGVVDGDVTLDSHEIKVGDAPDPVPAESQVTDLVSQWCQSSNMSRSVATSLGRNFMDANGLTTADLLKNLAEKNKATDQTGATDVLVKVQMWMIRNLSGKNYSQHKQALTEIGKGFLNHSEGR